MVRCNSYGWAYGELRAMCEKGAFELYHKGKAYTVERLELDRGYYLSIWDIEAPDITYLAIKLTGEIGHVLEAMECILKAYNCIDDRGYFEGVEGGVL